MDKNLSISQGLHTNDSIALLASKGAIDKRRTLKILNWNIQHGNESSGDAKTDDNSFCKLLSGCPIFCLQETKKEINIIDYLCFNQSRKDSDSGGLCIGLHKTFAKNYKLIDTKCPDIQAIKVKLGNEDNNITIINVYDSPENSAYKVRHKQEDGEDYVKTLDALLDFIANNTIGDVFLAGDFNARTKNLNHAPAAEDFDGDQRNPISGPSDVRRKSKDIILNSRGKLFLDFLASTNITVLNGNTIGDIFGEYTCVNYNGKSVVDYVGVSENLINNIVSFKVGDLTSYSDHKPCYCTLNINHEITSSEDLINDLEDAPNKYKWNEESTDTIEKSYLEAQESPSILYKLGEIQKTRCSSAEDVANLNSKVVDTLKEVADSVCPRKSIPSSSSNKKSHVSRKKRGTRMKPKKPWFDSVCINTKRELNRLAKKYGQEPTSLYLRNLYYTTKSEYKKLVKAKKAGFISQLSRDIESGTNINWHRFKRLKTQQGKGSSLDAFDMLNFCQFFKKLYSKPTLSQERLADLEVNKDEPSQSILEDSINQDITIDELEATIDQLKRGKAVSEDLIANEFLRSSGNSMRLTLCHLFNECLRIGAYPWNTSLVTPLHKKGSIYDPNNYRAIAVASNLGKLFSMILLQRLVNYRAIFQPDTPNQLGFCKGAQTSDHVLTLNTCITKYTHHVEKGRLYGCFVDFAKAFDTVCREALLYKLWQMGIRGRFFNCLEFMYQNSTAKVKLLKKLSESIEILCGTEQGHPMSPELFKCYINDLSEQLNSMADIDVPLLNNTKISHLLWADDLVLLSLDADSLQKMLDHLFHYCLEWGLSVNMKKTAVLVFNKTGRLLKESEGFFYGDIRISSEREYCYLGLTFSLSGSMISTQKKLQQKAMRSYFSLKKIIDFKQLKKDIVFKLFGALIQPIASYGCQVWLAETWVVKTMTGHTRANSLQNISKDPLEKLHLTFLKWTLGVNRKTSNAAVWGDCGRYPIAIELTKQVFSYYDRLQKLESEGSDSLVRHAYSEQRQLQLTWYKKLTELQRTIQERENYRVHYPNQMRNSLKKTFREIWETERKLNRKLDFYNSVKDTFQCEPYLNIGLSFQDQKRLAQFRTSSHKYKVETGRYGQKRNSVINRICDHCSPDNETVTHLSVMPFFEPIIEDEKHVLFECPQYGKDRLLLNSVENYSIKSIEDFKESSVCATRMRKLARYLNKCHNIRFPKDDISESKKIRDGMESESQKAKKTSSSKKKEKKKKH